MRHNFRDEETSLELVWKNGCKMRIVWPEILPREDPPTPFFYLLDSSGNSPRTPSVVRSSFSTIGVIPTLSPLEHDERILEDDTVKKNQSGRLSSRHFRNQLRMLTQAGKWDEFIDFASPWLAGIRLGKPVLKYDSSSIDVFFTEGESGVEKEIVWAGDGVQIWLQLLLHIYRAEDFPTLVLDEPEVFLHADLQRRLVRLLESLSAQVVLATHSTEVLAEADRRSVVWIDKSKKRAIRAPQDENLSGLDSALGTSFNLAMAKALRAKGVLFVEGKDVKVLKRLARSLSLVQLSAENSLAIVPMNGYSNRDHAEAFGWFLKEFLGSSVKAMVILDRDYRADAQVSEVVKQFAAVNLKAHVWKKKELESYLILPAVISRLSGCSRVEVEGIVNQVTMEMRNGVTSRLIAERLVSEKSTGRSVVSINEDVLNEVERGWGRDDYKLAICPPKEILSGVNRVLQGRGYKAASFLAIASSAGEYEIDPEMSSLLKEIDRLAE
ncbi:AAA family ATPase [Kitasatospora purpeofusca]|uniref:AAA family ATPase n=1 Tax=Kitasatospora purpeofusca TaxID=67352 RepID=UPI00365D1558